MSEEQIISVSAALHLTADMLLVPSLPGEIGLMPPWACNYVRKLLNPQSDTQEADWKDGPRVFLSRKTARYRRTINQLELYQLLKRWQFKIIDPADHSLQEQIKIANQASLIVGIHGAALTNILFARKGTPVIEIFSPLYVNPVYYYLSRNLGLQYFYSIGLGERPPSGVDPHRIGADVEVNLYELESLLEQVS